MKIRHVGSVQRTFKYLILLLICISPFVEGHAQGQFNTTARIQAMFVYNFTKYIEWPSDYKQGNFVIGVIGISPVLSELEKMAKTKKAVNQPIEVKRFSKVSEIEKCHMLIVSNNNAGNLSACLDKVRNYSTLVITEREGLARQGSGINFIIKDSKQKFELNKNNVTKKDLKVSKSLESLAILVN
ncbi:MAG: YfiR family protein [Flavobacteriales bacterium]|nr:YfiR family protein [Flavobacteriales bacterium]